MSGALHVPSPAQLSSLQFGMLSAQVPCGSLPAGTFVQVPRELATLHAWHPLHIVCGKLQHTPSTQWPSAHSTSCVHGRPSPSFAVHTFVALQKLVTPQSAFFEQLFPSAHTGHV